MTNISPAAKTLLAERYFAPGEDIDALFWRVARAVAQAEALYGADSSYIDDISAQFHAMMSDLRFLPNSPTLMNAGKGNNLQLSACYVLPIEDSLSGIFDTLKNAALIHQSGGGVGYSFSRIRPKGAMVKSTNGVASGPISFMTIYDAATEAVRQGGVRRGANMGILRVDHPDIEQFITCKLTGGITNFNISVAITDEFVSALQAQGDYALRNPATGEEIQRESAQRIFDLIVDAAWQSGDPGVVFLDRANRSFANPIPAIETIESTNPCVTGTTRLATNQGLCRMDDLFVRQEHIHVVVDARRKEKAAGGHEYVVGQVASHDATPVCKTGINAHVLKLTTSHGIEITATPEHRFLTTQGFKRLDKLQYGDELLLQSDEGGWSQGQHLPAIPFGPQSISRLQTKMKRGEAQPPHIWSRDIGEIAGYCIGNGCVHRVAATDAVSFSINAADASLFDAIHQRFLAWFGVRGSHEIRHGQIRLSYRGTPATFLKGLGISDRKSPEKRVPESIFAAPREAVVGFLRGLFSADGSVQSSVEKGACSVRLATSSKGLAQDVQQLLLNFGIVSAIRLRRQAGVRLLPDSQRNLAEYTQAQYEVIIDKVNRDQFAEVIGFMQARKQDALVNWIASKKRSSNHESYTTSVVSVEAAGVADVYDTTVPATHTILVNGLVTHNCGEVFLGPYDACNLGSINVSRYWGNAGMKWDDLQSDVRLAVRFLDDVIDINPFPLPQIAETVRQRRRIGLGVMGFADLLMLAGIRYGSDRSMTFASQIMGYVNEWARQASEELAPVRGSFPLWDQSIYRNDAPIRNSTRTTIAPTGSISIIAGCSSGIEPVFALAYQHTVGERVLDFLNPVFEMLLESLQPQYREEILDHVRQHGSLHGYAHADNSALAAFITAHEVSPVQHVLMQSVFQSHTDNAVSKTVNMPSTATREEVAEVYRTAWNMECLGVTVYRDGCKGQQVLTAGIAATVSSDARVEFPHSSNGVKSRPQHLSGTTHQITAPEGKVNVTINADKDGPVEVFVTVGKTGSDMAAMSEALGRLISLYLRTESGVDQTTRLRYAGEQLSRIGGSSAIGFGISRVRSLPDAVSQAIAHVLRIDQADVPVETSLGNVCPQCQNTTLIFEEGCQKCHGCGYSQC